VKIEAKKKFGQNFLKDSSVLDKIIQSMSKSERNLVEIGPGLGDLTQKLLEVKPVVAYEVDSELCIYLREKFSKEIESKRLVLVEGDVLNTFKDRSLSSRPYDLVANLPYYVATTIILKALNDPLCRSMVVMIQKEVAKKFSAVCKTKEFTSLAILAQSIAKSEILFDVLPESFEPSPKVISSVLKIEKKRDFLGEDGVFEKEVELRMFEKYLKYSFKAPRKTWLKNISSFVDKEFAKEILEKFRYPTTIRPHEISVSSHHLLFKELRNEDGREKRSC